MKRISFFLTLSLLILSFGLANAAQEVTVDHVDGSYIDGGPMLTEGAMATFHLRVTNTDKPGCKYAPAMSWAITSSNGATWGGLSIAYPVIYTAEPFPTIFVDKFFPDLFSSNFEDCFSCDGAIGDTVGVSGVAFGPDTAFFYGMDVIAFELTIGPVVNNGTGDGEICIEYGGSRSDGFDWGWNALDNQTAGCDGVPLNNNFVGGCYGIGTPPDLPPVIAGVPTNVTGSHCEVLQFDFTFTDPDPGAGPGPDAMTPSADIGALSNITDTSATWSYTGDLSEVGTPMVVHITVDEADNPTNSTDSANVVQTNDAPEFTSGCGAALFGQNGVTKTHVMGGSDSCPGDPMNFTVVDPGGITGTVEFVGNVLQITGVAVTDAGLHTITVGINDGVDSGATCTVDITLSDGATYKVSIEKTHGTIQGTFANVALTLAKTIPNIGGFNLLVAYDASALTFQGATQGNLLDSCDWEYFTYRYGADGNCNGGCPSGIVRVVGIAETNNGPNHPMLDCAWDGAVLANLSFLVSNDRTLECQYVPIRFWWLECGDNSISNASGDSLFLAATVKEYPGDGVDLSTLYTAEFPSFIGPEDWCYDGDKQEVLAGIDFINGGIDIVCKDSIDDRGDINLDGLANTIADAVMYSNYFVYGLTALVDVTTMNQYGDIPHYAGSIAASDVNADGLTLTVADLVYLIKVVIGDAQPYPKANPSAVVSYGETLAVDANMGGAFVVLAGEQNPTLLADGMELKAAFDGENTRVLVWSQEGNTFSGEFLGNIGDVVSVELATAEGAVVETAKLIPTSFALGQNYPNPFNPTTSIELSLPVASDYTVAIYNVTGQLVKEISGSAEAGVQTVEWDASNNASGVYFYKLTAGNFTDTKKMVLLK
jgi:hypothetical protein